jgi:hypothetical protein
MELSIPERLLFARFNAVVSNKDADAVICALENAYDTINNVLLQYEIQYDEPGTVNDLPLLEKLTDYIVNIKPNL